MAKKKFSAEDIDNNILFGMKNGEFYGLSMNNKLVNRSANALIIGGTGTGKTYKYVKPNLLQENCSMIVTDPSGDIFKSFAPYLISRGYNVQLFNVSDPTYSCFYNPLNYIYDTSGKISELAVEVLISLFVENAKTTPEGGGGSQDPFWETAEKMLLQGIMYYVLECDDFPKEKKTFRQIYSLIQEAKVDDDSDEENPLTQQIITWDERMRATGKTPKTMDYYKSFMVTPQKTANTVVTECLNDLKIFVTEDIARVTSYNETYKDANIDLDKIAAQQSYLFLCIPQTHKAFNFLVTMLYAQLYNRLYELGEKALRNKWHIGYRVGTPIFDYFNSEEEAKEFYETVNKKDNIVEKDYMNGTKIYHLMWHGHSFKSSFVKKALEESIDSLDRMYIWSGDELAGGDPALSVQVIFLLDEFANLPPIPEFLTKLATCRKYRIGSHIIIQNTGQIETIYSKGNKQHENLFANVDTTIFLGSIKQEDKEFIQKAIGKTTIRQKSTSMSKSGRSTSYTPTQVDVLSIDQIEQLNKGRRDDCIVIVRDCTPMVLNKLLLNKHPRYKLVKKCKIKEKDLRRYYTNNRSELTFF